MWKKLSNKEQAQLLIDKFWIFYFKRYAKKDLQELSDEEKMNIIEKLSKEWISWYNEKEERKIFIHHLKQVTQIKFLEPAFLWLWRMHKPKFLEN